MLKELVVIRLSHVFVFNTNGVFTLLLIQCLLIVDLRLYDLHISHGINHFLFGEQPLGHKTFVLVGTSGHKDK